MEDPLMDKIMKLKELASNYGASKAEATAAALAAQRLIAKCGIDENDLVIVRLCSRFVEYLLKQRIL